jgi:hypothetical protein
MENAVTPETGAGSQQTVLERFKGALSEPKAEAQPERPEPEHKPERDDARRQEEPGPDDSQDEFGAENDETEAEYADQQEPRYTVKVDGKDVEVTLEEALKGYSRESDYTRKTMKQAEEQKRFEAEKSQLTSQLQTQLNQATGLIQALEQQLLRDFKDVDFVALKRDDPIEYMLQKEQLQESLQYLQQVKGQADGVKGQLSQEQQQKYAEYLESQRQRLPEIVPEFANKETFEASVPKIRSYLETVGFAVPEIDGIADARALGIIYKAMQYDAMQKTRPEIDKKVNQAPKYAKPGTKPNRQISSTQTEKLRSAAAGGSEDALLSLFKNKLKK